MVRAFCHIPLRSYRRIPRRLVSVLCLLWLGMACAASHANTFTVRNLSDSGADSLRQAITDANTTPGADSIVFANGLTGTITLLTALPNLTDDVTLSGPGAKLLTVARSSASGTASFRIFTIDAGAATPPTVNISGLTLANGLIYSTLATDNKKGGGGAVLNNKANVTFTDCVIKGSRAQLSAFTLYPVAIGGGVYNYQGTMTLTRCTISNNLVQSLANGGGLGNDAGTMTLANCTISGNQAYYAGISSSNYAFGGGIWNSGTLNLTGCTFANNSARSQLQNDLSYYYPPLYIAGSGSSVYNAGTSSSTHLTLYQTILASGSTAGGQNIVSASGIVLNSLGYNVSNDSTGPNDGVTDRLNMDAKLSPLADYGGPTPTHLPLPGSPALDAGDPNFNNIPPATDQRGQPRVFNGRVDIGAVERQAIELVASDDAYSVKHDHTLRVTAPGVLANDTGAASLAAVLVASAAHGSLILNADGSFVYTPNAGYGVATNSADTFTYQAQDGNGHTSNTATVTITILADNPPTLTNSLSATATAGQTWNFTATATDADLPNDALTFSLVNAPTGMSINAATGAMAYTPKAEGTATFDIKVTDQYGESDRKTFTLTVQSDPNGSASLSITNVVVGRSNANTVTVSFNVINSGTGKATNLVISRATLGPWLCVANSAPVSVVAGGKQAYTLTFSGIASRPGVVYPLQIRGTYQAQNITQSLFYGGGVLVP